MLKRSLPAWLTSNSAPRYALAFAGVGFGLVAGRALAPILGGSVLYVAVLPAIAFSAWYCGLRASVASSAVALVALKYSFITPGHVLVFVTAKQVLDFIVIGAAAALVVALGETSRRECEMLRRAQDDLEERVRERTAELGLANQSLRELSARLMQSQDEERRRIARELHDSVGQSLVAMSLNLSTIISEVERLSQIKKAACEGLELAQEMSKEVRTVSYLLHPPLLDEAGLASALRWYVRGFSERSSIQVQLEISEDFGRLPQELETAIFRTAQECLTNIHRHSGSSVAAIRLARSETGVHLNVTDEGNGIPAEKINEVKSNGTPGVGIRGMRERMRQLGGTLEIHSDQQGTRVDAWLPAGAASAAAA
jgi:signal transduction histidine kinase